MRLLTASESPPSTQTHPGNGPRRAPTGLITSSCCPMHLYDRPGTQSAAEQTTSVVPGPAAQSPQRTEPSRHHCWAILSACRPAPSPTPAASHACASFLIIEKVQLGHKAATSDSKPDLDALCSARWVSVWPFAGCGKRCSAAVWPGEAGSPATLGQLYGSPGTASSGRRAARGHTAPGVDAARRRSPSRGHAGVCAVVKCMESLVSSL